MGRLFGAKDEPCPPIEDEAARQAREADERLSALARRFEGDPLVVALELVWGEARVSPGADDEDARRLATLSLRPGASLGVFGAGLGASARLAADRGFAVTAYEWREPLFAELRKRFKARPGCAAPFEAQPFDQRTPNLGDAAVDAIVVDQRLMEFDALEPVLIAIRRALRPEARCLLLEPVIETGADPRSAALGFTSAEARLRTLPEWLHAFKSADLERVEATDATGAAIARLRATRRRILSGYDDLIAAAGAIPHAREALALVGLELAASQNRLESLERGDLAVYRFVAAKPRRGS